MKPLFRPLLVAMCVSLSCHAASPLETLFDNKDYAAFLPQAEARAAAGDVEALFLLGKAYDFGRGVAEDQQRARSYYEQARSLGSARASHNLGLMEGREGRPEKELELLQEALARGLKMPTLYNLGLATSPADPDDHWGIRRFVSEAGRAGDYFAAAFAEDGSDLLLLKASREYTRAALTSRQGMRMDREEQNPEVLRARAVEWLEKGMARGLGEAWTNYGTVLLVEQNYVLARGALDIGAEKGVAVAHYHLARMDGSGLGIDGADRRSELQHYEQAALLGLELAKRPARTQLLDYLDYVDDLDVLEEGMRRLEALGGPDEHDDYSYGRFLSRLSWARRMRDEQRNAPRPTQRSVRLRACGLGLEHPLGSAFNLGRNTQWRLAAYQTLEVRTVYLEGRVDAEGCAASPGPLPPEVRESLGRGQVLALQFPNYSLPLQWREQGGEIVLELPAQPEPLPR